jgi:hypothetical protein
MAGPDYSRISQPEHLQRSRQNRFLGHLTNVPN